VNNFIISAGVELPLDLAKLTHCISSGNVPDCKSELYVLAMVNSSAG